MGPGKGGGWDGGEGGDVHLSKKKKRKDIVFLYALYVCVLHLHKKKRIVKLKHKPEISAFLFFFMGKVLDPTFPIM